MKTKIVIAQLLLLAALPWAQAEVVQETKAFLKEQLGSHPKKTKETFPLTEAHRKSLRAVAERATDQSFSFYFARDAADKLQVACTVVPQEGKEGPMQIGACFDGGGLVTAVRVLEFQEDHGKPVKEVPWLKKTFDGKKAASAFRIGKDVDAVSGATRSSEAVSEAVRKAGWGYQEFVEKKGKKQ
jgi:Na+-translocating ferredoxin:NAD+ oxidoreductase RnfG subunit